MMLMWVFLFALVVTDSVHANDDADDNDDCSRDTVEVCKLGDVAVYMRRMLSDSNVGQKCKVVLESLECVIRVEQKCNFDETMLSFAKQSLPVIEEKCSMYKAIPDLPSIDSDTSGSMEEDMNCSLPTAHACKLGEIENLKGGLRHRCRTLLVKAECIVRVEEKCNFNRYIYEMAKKQLPSLKEKCGRYLGEETREVTNYGLGGNGNILFTSMQCIKNVLNDEVAGYCASPPCKFKLMKYAEALLKKEIISEVNMNTLMCITGMNAFSCLAVTVENKCGDFAFNQYMKVMSSVAESVMINCGDLKFEDIVPTMLEVYREHGETENLLKRLRL